MRHLIKKLLLILCVVALSACGGVKEVLDATKDKIDENREPDALDENIEALMHAESYSISQNTIDSLKSEGVPARVTNALLPLMNQVYTSQSNFEDAFTPLLSAADLKTYKFSILRYATNG